VNKKLSSLYHKGHKGYHKPACHRQGFTKKNKNVDLVIWLFGDLVIRGFD